MDSYSCTPRNQTIALTEADQEVYVLANKLVDKTYDLNQGFAPKDSDEPTGSWTSIYLHYATGDTQTIPENDLFDAYGLNKL